MSVPHVNRRSGPLDRSRDRSVLLNQILYSAVAAFGVLLMVLFDQLRDPVLLIVGLAVVFVVTGATVLAPWQTLPFWMTILPPAGDLVSILVLREAGPGAGIGLIAIFPAMWAASAFGALGLVLPVIGMCLLFFVVIAGGTAPGFGDQALLLPLLVTALATMSYLSARRATAQRFVLDRQSHHLQQSMERARSQEDLVTEVLDAVDFGVIRLDPAGEPAFENDSSARLQRAGADRGSGYAMDGLTLLDPEDEPLERARRGETFENLLVWYGAPREDDRQALRSTARRISSPDAAHRGTLVVTRDVTREEEALRAREDLVASVSHELRTPLTSITGYLELALDDPGLPDSARRSLEVAERNAGRLLDLVTDILASSVASSKGVEPSIVAELVDVSPIVTSAVEAALPQAGQRRITVDSSGVEEAIAFADPHRIRQVVDNLVSNAVKYNVDDGRVEVGSTWDGLHTWIVVRDHGPGIPAHDLPHVFDRFYRSESVRHGSIHGSGLGLAISRDIIRAHGGEITVQSTPEEGTTFLVRLPSHDPLEGAR